MGVEIGHNFQRYHEQLSMFDTPDLEHLQQWQWRATQALVKPLATKVEEATRLLGAVVDSRASDAPLIINFSGGRDSLVCLHLAMRVTRDVACCYADGGFELPQTVKYVRERCEEFDVSLHVPVAGEVQIPHRTLPADMQTLGDFVRFYGCWPTKGKRWCSTWFKQRLMKAYWRTLYSKDVVLYKVNGVRMFESATRLWKYGDPAHYTRHIVGGNRFLRYDAEHRPCILVYPILEWTDQDVQQYLEDNKVAVHDGYKLYGVSGCKWCPVHPPEVYAKILWDYPAMYDDIREIEDAVLRPAVAGGVWLKDIQRRVSAMKSVTKGGVA